MNEALTHATARMNLGNVIPSKDAVRREPRVVGLQV